MSGNSVSEFGKRVGEDDMSTVALQEALHFHDVLMDAEFKGRKDNESAARFRLSKKTGVPESYLFRLTYKRSQMRDVAGEVYRRLRESYVALCEKHEAAADAYRAERLKIEAERNASNKGLPDGGMGMGASEVDAMAGKEKE